MAKKRCAQSPAEATKLQASPKRQEQEKWTIGLPLPTSLIPPGFIPNPHFQPQIAIALPDGLMVKAITTWESKECKSRPRFARLLHTEWLQKKRKLLAAYLGFNTVSELYYFVDFEEIGFISLNSQIMLTVLAVPKTAKHLVRLYYRPPEQRYNAGYANANASERFGRLESDRKWLKPALDRSGPDQILISVKPSHTKLITDESTITLGDIDPVLSLLAASYKLIKANPNRFCQQQPPNPDEYTWNIHHEDWMRAHAVITLTRARQSYLADMFDINVGQFPSSVVPVAFSFEEKRSELHGYATDELLAKMKHLLGGHNEMAAAKLIQEITTLDPEHGVADMSKLSQFAINDHIIRVLNTTGLLRFKAIVERDRIIHDTDGALSEVITEVACTTLGTIAPGIDLNEAIKSLNIPTKMQRSTITESEREALQTLLKSQACRAQFDVPKPILASSTQNHQVVLRSVSEEGEILSDSEPDEHTFSTGILNTELENLRKTTAQLGENLPPNQDLISICSLRGIDVNTLAVNPYSRLTVAKAPQIPDANLLTELLGGRLRTAMLHSECGSGKTFVTLLALKFLIDERINKFKNGTLHVEKDDRVFKPSIIFVPSATLRQFFAEISSHWMGVFDIWLLYQVNDNCMDLGHKTNVINNTEQLQTHINHWATEHKSSNTARVLILTSYETGVKLMPISKVSQSPPNEQIQGVAAQEQHSPNSVLGYAPLNNDDNNKDENGHESDKNGFYCRLNTEQDATGHTSHEKMIIQNDMWNVVVLDECQFIKKETSSYNKLARQLDRDALLLVSANPLATLQDLCSYLRVMWDAAWPFSYLFESDSALRKTLYDPAAYDHLLKREDLYGVTLKRVVTGGEIMTDKLTPRQRQRCEEYIEFVLGGYGPAYLLHPELFKDLWFTEGYETGALISVSLKILEMISVRRGMLTPMKLPNGDVTYVGKGIASLAIRTVELTSTASVRQRLYEHISRLEKMLEYPGGVNVEEEIKETVLNRVIRHRLSMISTDVNNATLTTPTARLLRNLLILKESVTQPMSTVGSKDMSQPITFDATGGLQWLFYNTRESQKYSFPTDGPSQVKYAAWDSPKYCHVLLKALEAMEREEKLLIYVNNPLTLQIINALLVACGIKTLHWTPRHSQSERNRAVEAFNNTLSPYTCLVASLELSAFGLNLHKSCHRGIIVELPLNGSTLLSAIGRLWRIGQKHDVDWEILIARHSFDACMEARIMEKYSAVLAVTARVDTAISGEARKICAYEIIREQFGQEYSRYPRIGVSWSKMDEDDMHREGYFYSALADFFFKNPQQAFLVGRSNIREIARAWKMGMEITIDIVKNPIPLEDGEGLSLSTCHFA
ncbi:hypothetical protein ACHAQJ_003783 [Trichoderma viride]